MFQLKPESTSLRALDVPDGIGCVLGRGLAKITHQAISREALHCRTEGDNVVIKNTGRFPLHVVRKEGGQRVTVGLKEEAILRTGDSVSLLDPNSMHIRSNPEKFQGPQDPHTFVLERTGPAEARLGEAGAGSRRRRSEGGAAPLAVRDPNVASPATAVKPDPPATKIARSLDMDDVSHAPQSSSSSRGPGRHERAGAGGEPGGSRISSASSSEDVAQWILDVTEKASVSSKARQALEKGIRVACDREDINGSVLCDVARSVGTDFQEFREMLETHVEHQLSFGVATKLKNALRDMGKILSEAPAVSEAPAMSKAPAEPRVSSGGAVPMEVEAGSGSRAGGGGDEMVPAGEASDDKVQHAESGAASDLGDEGRYTGFETQSDTEPSQPLSPRDRRRSDPAADAASLDRRDALPLRAVEPQAAAGASRETGKHVEMAGAGEAGCSSGAHSKGGKKVKEEAGKSQAQQSVKPCSGGGDRPAPKQPVVIVLDDSDDEQDAAVQGHVRSEVRDAANGSSSKVIPNDSAGSRSSSSSGEDGEVFSSEKQRQVEEADHALALSLQFEEETKQGGATREKQGGAEEKMVVDEVARVTQEVPNEDVMQEEEEQPLRKEEEPIELVAKEEKNAVQHVPEPDVMEEEEVRGAGELAGAGSEALEVVAKEEKPVQQVPSSDMMEEEVAADQAVERRASSEEGGGGGKMERGRVIFDTENEEELAEQVFEQMSKQQNLAELEKDAEKRLGKDWFSVELKRHQMQGLGWMLMVEERRKQEGNKFPSGGILADTMGLGKTLTLLSLIATTAHEESKDRDSHYESNSKRGGGAGGKELVCVCKETIEVGEFAVQCTQCSRWLHADDDDCEQCEPEQRFRDDVVVLMGCKRFCYVCKACSLKASGNESLDAPFTTLIVAPKSVASMWREEVEEKAPHMRVLLYYNNAKKDFAKDSALFNKYDIVITTYGSLKNECPTEKNNWQAGPLFRTKWRRVALDEAHEMRNKGTKVNMCCKTLEATTYWCLTGTPVVNYLTDFEAYALFICNQNQDWEWLPVKLKQLCNAKALKNDAGLAKHVQELFVPILLRRNKDDKIDDNKIIQLPEKVVTIKDDLRLSERESVLYGRLERGFERQFMKMVHKGYKANMMNILALLMRLRQFCNHPGLLPASMLKALVDQDKEEDGGVVDGESSDSDDGVAKEEGGASSEGGKGAKEEGAKEKGANESWSGKMARRASAAYGEVMSQSQPQSQSQAAGGGEDDGDEEGEDGKQLDMEDNLEEVEAKMIEDEDAQKEDEEELFPGPSSKALAVVDEIKSMLAEDASYKILVFCMFPRFFDMLTNTKAFEKIKFLRIDGKDGLEARASKVDKFKKNPKIRVFLMSTKCCCHGLNLTIACRGIIVDPWWNSGSEEQAVDRMHRLGQLNIVKVTKFIVAGTVEERMYIIQQEKAEMAARALGESKGGATRRKQNLSLDDLKRLFGAARRAAQPVDRALVAQPQGGGVAALAGQVAPLMDVAAAVIRQLDNR